MSDESHLLISTEILELLKKEALEAYPEECCGILVGRVRAQEPRKAEVHEVKVARNSAVERRQEQYSIDPEQLLRVQTEARKGELDVLGYYHSHPEERAIPGQVDLETAWPDTSYLILAVGRERVTEVRCWRLRESGEAFEEVQIGYSLCPVDSTAGAVKR